MEYFAGANTRNGFVSIFEERFRDIGRLYILKGSSGCGKSTFMRKAMMRAREFGIPYDVIYCSADSNSVDGVVFKTLGIAIADGTSPHILEVKYPCVRETLIDLGRFWNEKKLLPKEKEIIKLTDQKSAHYKNAYKCISAMGVLDDFRRNLINASLHREKLDKAVLRIAERAAKGRGESEHIFATAFNAGGFKSVKAFQSVNTLYRISGPLHEIFINSLSHALSELGVGCVLALSPTDVSRVNAVYIKESGDLFTDCELPLCESFEKERVINTLRFADKSVLGGCKNKLRAAERLIKEIECDAQKELEHARSAHNEIEKIYIPAMDFGALDEFTERLLTKLIRAE